MAAGRMLTLALIGLLALFGVLQLLGVQPGEDNHRWLLFLFVLVWPLLSLGTFIAAISIMRRRRREAIPMVVVAVLSLAGFAVWADVYLGLW